jgi:hypothetical protein
MLTVHEIRSMSSLREECPDLDPSLCYDSMGRYRIEGRRGGEVLVQVAALSLGVARRSYREAYAKATGSALAPKVRRRSESRIPESWEARRRAYLIETGRIDQLRSEKLEHI